MKIRILTLLLLTGALSTPSIAMASEDFGTSPSGRRR
jgi:hypothetical protein